MVKERRESDSAAQNVACHAVERERASSLGSLRISRLYSTDEAGVVGEVQVDIYRKVVAYPSLTAAYLDYLIEVGNLVACADSNLPGCRLHYLSRL